jgi:predicted ATPase/DNA-binding SARP family transcriptional activator
VAEVLQYGILGPLSVRRDGVEVAVSARKPRVLLVTLVLDANRVVSVDRLIDELWPADVPVSALKLVQVYVSQLRAAVEGIGIETVTPGYRLVVAPDAVDAARFEDLHDQSRQALARGNPDLALALADRALALWRGPALADLADAPSAVTAAARLDALRLDCVEDRLDAMLAMGRHHLAVLDLERLCSDHPLRERAREKLALALYRSGRQADALTVLADGRRLLRDELGLDPAPTHQRLEHAILTQSPTLDPPSAAAAEWPSLPAPATPLIGRHEELDSLATLVKRDDVRLATVVGPGGTGKTRLTLELATSVAPHFANGVVVVELAPLRDPALVPATIAHRLGLTDTAEQPTEALARRLRGLEILLVLDNFEHLVDAADDLAAILRDTDRTTVLVTSRRVLHVAGEHVFPLQPLPVDAAMQLFTDRVEARGRLRAPGDGEDGTIEAICRRLDCLPLALELAAARTAAMTPRRMLDRLRDRVTVLGAGPRDAPARQRTLTDTITWSTDLLDDEQRRVFARLSLFAGGFTLDAAETVCEASTNTIEVLVDCSLIQHGIVAGDARLTMLETVREHAAERLEGDDRAVAEAAHVAYYAAFTASLTLTDRAAYDALPQIDPEIDNLRLAIDRATANGDDDTALRIAVDLDRYWATRGLYREGIERISGPLERGAGEPRLRGTALHRLAGLSYISCQLDEASAFAHRGIATGTAAHHVAAVGGCHNVLGIVALDRDDLDSARHHLERAESIAAQLGIGEDLVIATCNLADLAMMEGDDDEARRRWEQTLTMNDTAGLAPWTESNALLGLGAIARRQGRLGDAHEQYTRAHQIAESTRFPHNTAVALIGLAGVAVDRGDHHDAAHLLAEAERLLAATGVRLTAFDAQLHASVQSAIRSALNADRVDHG